jgi:hypothetical protein
VPRLVSNPEEIETSTDTERAVLAVFDAEYAITTSQHNATRGHAEADITFIRKCLALSTNESDQTVSQSTYDLERVQRYKFLCCKFLCGSYLPTHWETAVTIFCNIFTKSTTPENFSRRILNSFVPSQDLKSRFVTICDKIGISHVHVFCGKSVGVTNCFSSLLTNGFTAAVVTIGYGRFMHSHVGSNFFQLLQKNSVFISNLVDGKLPIVSDSAMA